MAGLYTSSFYYWNEPKGTPLEPTDVLEEAQWQKLSGEINFGFNNAPIWVMQDVKAYRAGEWVLQLNFPLIDYLDIYVYRKNQLVTTIKTGDARPFSQRSIPVPYFTVGLFNEEPTSFLVLLRIETKGALVLPHKWWAEADYAEQLTMEQAIFGAFYGILFMMAFYHLFVYLVVRDKNYLFFVFTIFSYALLRMSFDGRGFAWLWPETPSFNAYAFPIFFCLNHFAVLTFINSFLDLKHTSPKLYFINAVLRGVVVFNFVSIFVLDYSIQSPISVMTGAAISFSGLISGSYLWFKGFTTARYFTIAWAIFLCGQFLLNLRGLGLADTTWWITYGSLIGSLFQVLFFGFSLADRIQNTNRLKLEAEKALVKSKDGHLFALQRYQDLYENSPIGNFQSDTRYRLTSVNKACAKVFGFDSQEEMIEKLVDIRDYLQTDFEQFHSMIRQANKEHFSPNNELLIKTEKGELRWISVNLSFIDTKELTGYEGTIQEITERKLAEQLKDELDHERLKIMEQFSLGIAKEISLPLGSNVATTAFMREGLDDMAALEQEGKATLQDYEHFFGLVKNSLGLVGSNQRRITKIVKRFREVSAWHQSLKLSHISVSDAIESVVSTQRWRMAGWKVDIECDAELSIYSYQSALKSILIQLIDNALVHSHADDGPSPAIRINVTEEKDNIVVNFSDNGEGIKKELVKNLCKPFFTTDKGPDGHIGLGLYMVYNLVCIALKGRVFFPVSGVGFSIQAIIPKQLDK